MGDLIGLSHLGSQATLHGRLKNLSVLGYVKFVADHLLTSLNLNKLYNVENPFEWMSLISLNTKQNFIEGRVREYKKKSNNQNIDLTITKEGDKEYNYKFKIFNNIYEDNQTDLKSLVETIGDNLKNKIKI